MAADTEKRIEEYEALNAEWANGGRVHRWAFNGGGMTDSGNAYRDFRCLYCSAETRTWDADLVEPGVCLGLSTWKLEYRTKWLGLVSATASRHGISPETALAVWRDLKDFNG